MSEGQDSRWAFARKLLGFGPDEEIPGVLPVWRKEGPCAGRALGLSRAKTYALCQQGTFPVPLLPYHGNGKNDYRVSTYLLLQLLGLTAGEGPDDAQGGSSAFPVLPGGLASNGRHEGEPPVNLPWAAGGSSSSGGSR